MNTSKFKEMSVSEMQNVDGGMLRYCPILPSPVLPVIPFLPSIIKNFIIWC